MKFKHVLLHLSLYTCKRVVFTYSMSVFSSQLVNHRRLFAIHRPIRALSARSISIQQKSVEISNYTSYD